MLRRWLSGVALNLLLLGLAGCSSLPSPEPVAAPDPGTTDRFNPVPPRVLRVEPVWPSSKSEQLQGKGSVWVDGEANPKGIWEPFYVWTGGPGTCSVGTTVSGSPEWQREYPCPKNLGQLTIYQIDQSGMSIAFLTAQGGSGTFHLVSHAWTFSESGTPEGLYPANAKTGVEGVDRFLQAVVDRNAGQLDKSVKLAEYQCSKAEGNSGAPPCEPSEPENTTIKAFVRAACNVQFVRDESLARELTAQWLLPRPLWLHSAYALEPRPISGMAAYALVLAGHPEDNQAITAYLDANGMLVQMEGHCGPPSLPSPEAKALLPKK